MEVEKLCGFEEGGEIELLSLLVLKVKLQTGSSWPRRESVPEARVPQGHFPPKAGLLSFFVVLKPHLKTETRLLPSSQEEYSFIHTNASKVMISLKQQSLYAELPR